MLTRPDSGVDDPGRKRIHPLRYGVGAVVLLVLLLAWHSLATGEVRALEVTSGSMAPTLEKGDCLLVRKFPAGDPTRGMLVVITSPDDNGPDLVKRLVAVPGDTTEIRDHVFLLDGVPSPPPTDSAARTTRRRLPPHTLGPDEYFVLGDNRGDSHDSEDFGPINRGQIVGRVLWRYAPSGRRGRVL